MQLIYRGHTFHCTLGEPKTYQPPRAVNWRYQAMGATNEGVEFTTPNYTQPRSLNWRWR
jgi:hypothetical protein